MSKVGYNPFAGLTHDDSSDSEKEDTQIQIKAQPTAPNTPSQTTKNIETSPSLRVWKLTKEEEQTRNSTTFGSPFSVKKKGKTKQNHTHADNDGWVSIRKNQPTFLDDSADSSESEKEIKKEALMEALVELSALDTPSTRVSTIQTTGTGMRSLLNRGHNEMTAMDWAERVRVTLEKSEASRRTPSSQASEEFVSSLGRLSFFRRGEETK